MLNLHDMFDTYINLRQQSSSNKVYEAIQRFAGQVELPHTVYGCFSGEVSLAGMPNVMHIDYPAAWVEEYFSEGLIAIDPVVNRLANAGKASYWHRLAITNAEKKFLERAASNGLVSGCAIPLFGPNGSQFALSFASGDKVTAEQGHWCWQISHFCHSAFLEGFNPLANAVVTLSDQQRRVLLGLSKGQSREQVADELAITRHGVDYHLKSISKALGTNNITHTVAEAVRRNLV